MTGVKSRWLHPLLLLAWLIIGAGLRLSQLTSKPPWTDEFSTIVFSLGNSFRTVPLDRAITLDVLLQPLQPSSAGVLAVVHNLLSESNHPPLYFMLAHWWMQFWPSADGISTLWAARSLSALLGAASIPAVYGLGWLAFHSRLVSQLAAAIMAVSPYGIFLAQEARHYTLAILWVIVSLGYLVIATRHIQHRKLLPVWVTVSWISINFLGVSTHYFFALTLAAEALCLILLNWQQGRGWIDKKIRGQIYTVAAGAVVGCLLWLPIFLHNSHGNKLTEWIQQSGDRGLLAWISPLFQDFAAWITMLFLLPIEASSLAVAMVSGFVMLIFFIWAVPILSRSFRTLLKQPATRLITQMFVGVICSAIALFFFFAYAFGIDLTRGARYNFVYFPAVIISLGASLAACWNTSKNGKTSVALIWLMGLMSGLTVVCNLGYEKYYRPDLLVPLIQQISQSPVLIATTHKTHVQTGELMGIASVLKSGSLVNPLFLLAHQDQNPNTSTTALQHTLIQVPRPLDLWLVNFHAPVELKGCVAVHQPLPPVNGYDYQLYRCVETAGRV